MELCELCQAISRRKWKVASGRFEDEGEWIEHHESYSNLCKSVSESCRLCTLLRHGLLDEMRYSPGEWGADNAEAWQLERDAEQESKFWIVQNLTYPGDGEGIICDTALLNGLYYRRCSLPLTSMLDHPNQYQESC